MTVKKDRYGFDLLHVFGNLVLVKAGADRAFWGGQKGAAFALVQLPTKTLEELGLDDEVDRSLKMLIGIDLQSLRAEYVMIEDTRTGEMIRAFIFVQGSGNNWDVSTYDSHTDAIFYQQRMIEGSPGRAVASFIEEQAQLFEFPLGY